MHNGRIIQEGRTGDVFRRPVNRFVARYAGIKNFFKVEFEKENGTWEAVCGNLRLSIPENNYPAEGLLILRSEDIKVFSEKPSGEFENIIKGKVNEIIPSESGMEIVVDAGQIFYIDISNDCYNSFAIAEQSEIWITFPSRALIPVKGSN